MAISAQQVKDLREETGLGMMDCKKALAEAEGDKEKAKEILRKKGLKAAEKRAGRATGQGLIGSYVHFDGKLGVIVEVNCESDFVARSADFKTFVADLSMHIANSDPSCVSRDEIDTALIEKEKAILAEELGKVPEQAREKAIEGKLSKGFYSRHALLDQPFVKDEKKTVGEVLSGLIAKTGENCKISRFVRLRLGGE